MKRGDFIRSLAKRGCYLYRHGKRHDIYANPRTGRKAPVPRHPEIKESLVRLIEHQLGV
ncbi:MAG TPA: type II toxin-antitoxin system HicA family toxin [Candidatus Heimdallarchaeota archaeon]|nr:type II toxin-antitoxin system HicA family toxin [Candidatus Heimdallarchaeota archaeon]